MTKSQENKMAETIKAIATEDLELQTLETRNSDSLDFQEVSVWGLKEALENAYKAGMEASK